MTTTYRQDTQGTQTMEGQPTLQGSQDQDIDSPSDPNSTGALSPELTSSPAQVRQQGEKPAPSK